jgi:hypothetical protein
MMSVDDRHTQKTPNEPSPKPSTPVPYPNPEKVDREFYDLHGIPYPQSMEKDWLESEHQDETYGSQT